jgi:hypothetical protein
LKTPALSVTQDMKDFSLALGQVLTDSQRRVVAAWPKPDHEGTGLLRKFRFGLAGGHAPDDDFLGAATPLLDQATAVKTPAISGLRRREAWSRFRSAMVMPGGNSPVLVTSSRSS